MRYAALAGAILVALGAWWLLSGSAEAPAQGAIGNVYTSTEHGITFSYPDGSSPLSNFGLSGGTPAEVLVGTESALAFAWDGLYTGTTIAQARGDKIYAFSVTYLSVDDPIRTHFAQVVASATFQ